MDDLTGIGNRRAFNRRLEAEINTFKSTEEAFSLLAIDIDYFKKFNDKYGHSVGDKVLKFVATTMNAVVKGGDGLYRTGGEEFGVILPKTSAEGSLIVAEQVRSAVAGKKLIINADDNITANITVSIGASTFTSKDSTISISDRADKNLYLSKHRGRNRVTGEKA